MLYHELEITVIYWKHLELYIIFSNGRQLPLQYINFIRGINFTACIMNVSAELKLNAKETVELKNVSVTRDGTW
jgi:hypothetical protein